MKCQKPMLLLEKLSFNPHLCDRRDEIRRYPLGFPKRLCFNPHLCDRRDEIKICGLREVHTHVSIHISATAEMKCKEQLKFKYPTGFNPHLCDRRDEIAQILTVVVEMHSFNPHLCDRRDEIRIRRERARVLSVSIHISATAEMKLRRFSRKLDKVLGFNPHLCDRRDEIEVSAPTVTYQHSFQSTSLRPQR